MTNEFDDDRSKEPGRRQMAFARALPMLLFVILAMAIVTLLVFRNLGDLRTSAAVYDQSSVVCTGQTTSGAAPYSDAAGIHPVVVFVITNNGLIQSDQTLIRESWIPADVAELELVLCLENQRPAIRPLCENTAVTNPLGLEADATLYEAVSGQIIAEGIIASDARANADCLEEPPESFETVDRFSGDGVAEWLEPFVEK